MYFKWFLFLIAHAAVVVARYPLSPIAVIFFTTNDKRELLAPFHWLGTLDNDLSGDDGWKNEHITGDPLSTWNRIKWLWRNGGNALNYTALGVPYDKWYALTNWIIQDTRNFWKRPDGAWQLRARVPVFGRVWTPYIGWGLFGPVDQRCKFTCTILRFNKVA
jgi:hypothetical protein